MKKHLTKFKGKNQRNGILVEKKKEEITEAIKRMKEEIEKNKLFITNLGKCTQIDARPLPDEVLKKYLDLLFKEINIIKPKIIITTGTHTAVPMCYIGKIFGSKIIFIETFANKNTKTLSGKMVYPIADLFIVQWEEMKKLYPKAVYGGAIY